MRRKTTYDKILFGILVLLSFLPMLQWHFQLIPLKALEGVTVKAEQPKFNFETYRSGDYAKQEEAFLSQNFGFREPVLRLYNQYLWTCYKKTYAKDVVAGKDGWLYYPQSVSDYYGKELLKWQPSVEKAKRNFDKEVKYLNWARTILKENGTDLLVFMAPEKGFLYPEHLPDNQRDTTTFNAWAYFADRFEEIGFPCIEMTRWFLQMKDTVNYPLIPQTGAHWTFPAVYAADSLFRFMGDLKGIRLPQIKLGPFYEAKNHAIDNDLEHLLNLSLPMRHQYGFSPRAEVNIVCDSNTVKPKVLFIGNSFFWAFATYLPLNEIFDEIEFWYYFSTAYFGEKLKQTAQVKDFHLLERLLDFDYVVWFTTGNQMNKGTTGFADIALVNLCVSDSLMRATANHIKDSLSISYWDAKTMITAYPELIPELRGDSLRLRSSNIPYAKIIKDIRKNSSWMAALEAQAFLRTATLKMMLRAEAEHMMKGKPLYRDQTAEIQFSLRCQQEVAELMQKIQNEPQTMEIVVQQAKDREISLQQSLKNNAEWLIRRKYRLHECEFLTDPDAEIPLPPDFQLN